MRNTLITPAVLNNVRQRTADMGWTATVSVDGTTFDYPRVHVEIPAIEVAVREKSIGRHDLVRQLYALSDALRYIGSATLGDVAIITYVLRAAPMPLNAQAQEFDILWMRQQRLDAAERDHETAIQPYVQRYEEQLELIHAEAKAALEALGSEIANE